MEDVVGNNPALSDQKHSTIKRFSLQLTISENLDIYIQQILRKDSSINQILGRQGEGLSITQLYYQNILKTLIFHGVLLRKKTFDFLRSNTPQEL